ncbi:MAG: TonB-dependent receptor [Oceanicaulis sp.]
MKSALVMSASLAALAAAPAFAKTAVDAAAADTETSDVIVVTATRTALSNFDYPGLTSAIVLENLEQERPTDLAGLLEDVPGLEVAGGPRRTGQTLNLRGFGRESVTLLVDGARQNFASAHDGVLFLDPSLLGRVETVRGSAGALYGSGAAGGVIAFETLEADDLLREDETFGARASLGYRSVNEETRGSGAVFGEAGAFEGIAALSVRRSGDIALGSGTDLPSEDEVVSGLLAGEWDVTDALEIEAGWLSFRNEAREPNNGQGNETVGGLNPLVDKDVIYDSLRLTAAFDPDSALVDLQATVYRNVGEVDEVDPAINRFIERDLETDGIRLENRAVFALFGNEAALVSGAEWYRDEQIGFDSATIDNRRGGVPSGETEFTGAWLQLETRFDLGEAGELIVLPGVRFDSFETSSDVAASNSDDAVSPRIAATWALDDGVRLFASWSEAFRAPSLNELYITDTHFSLPHPVLGPPTFITNEFIANPDLRPEHTETFEIGAGFIEEGVFAADDRFEIKGAYFNTTAEDLIDLGVNFALSPTCFAPPFFSPCSAGTSFSTNRAEATLEGFEIAAAYTYGPLRLDAALFEVDGEDEATGDPLGALQPRMGHVRARYEVNPQLTLGGRLGFASEFNKTTDPAAERDGYAVLDLYAGWKPFTSERVRIDVGVDNVLDEDYERVFAGVSEPGRSFRIDLTWTGGW